MAEPLVLSAGHQLRDQAGALADAVVACEFSRNPRLRLRYGPGGRGKSRQDAAYHLAFLADAVDVDSQAVFNDYIAWAKVLLLHFGVLAEDLDLHLGCMAEVMNEQMPAPVAASAVAMIEAARSALPAMPATASSCLDPGQRLEPLAREYVRALLGGYRQAAAQLVYDAVDRGASVREMYLQVFQPALREVGRLWQTRRVSVAQEHFCSAATQVVMSQLLPRSLPAPRRGRAVVVACVSGDLHELGARMVADFFTMEGWDAYFCGANTPHEGVVQSVAERGAQMLAVSASMGCHLHTLQELLERVRADPRCADVCVMVGGHPFTVDPLLWRTIGADGTAADAEASIALAERWLAGQGTAP
jgi:methylmalonyl-CoA mutase cobalamin-binding domain/chain